MLCHDHLTIAGPLVEIYQINLANKMNSETKNNKTTSIGTVHNPYMKNLE